MSAYSYSLHCVQCTSSNWIKYVALCTLPITVLYLCLVFFRFRATDPIIHEFVIYSQLIMNLLLTVLISEDIQHDNYLPSRRLKMVTYTLLGVWNLDFGRLLVQPFCLHPRASLFQLLVLDYLVALYPLALVFLSFALVKLHSSLWSSSTALPG